MIKKLNKQEFLEEAIDIDFRDKYYDFYITKDNKRLFFNKIEILKLYASLLDKGEICYGNNEDGFILTYGLTDKNQRVFLKIFYLKNESIEKLLNIFLTNHSDKTYFMKIKQTNPIFEIAKKKEFYIKGLRGKEVLICKEGKITGDKNGNRTNKVT